MENLILPATTSTPAVNFDAASGVLSLKGESYPENAFGLYRPLLDWISSFLDETSIPVKVEIGLTYLNTSSIKSLMDLLDVLEDAHKGGRQVTLTWYCDEDNDRAVEMAEEFREEVTLPFFVVSQGS